MTDVTIIFVTAGSEDEAMTIGRKLVEERLVACVNVIPRIRSIYWWKDEICNADEYLMVMKTRSTLFHPYRLVFASSTAMRFPRSLGFVLRTDC